MEINKGLIKMIITISFDGRPSGEPYQHLEAFEDICDLFNTTEDEVKLRVFPFTLTNKAKDWFKRLTPGSIKTWKDLKYAFLSRYFPISKVNKIKAEIRQFKQGKEHLAKAWERYKDLLLKLPSHGIDDKEVMDIFYAGLTNDSRLWLDSSCGGIFHYKTVTEARKLLDDLEAHYLDWSTDEEESTPAQLNGISSSDEPQIKCTNCGNAPPTECHTWKSILAQSKPSGGIIEQLFHHFLEQGKKSTNKEQQLRGTDQILREVKGAYPHVEIDEQAEVFSATRGGKVVVGPPMPKTDQIPNMQVVEPEIKLSSLPRKEVKEETVGLKESTTPHEPTRIEELSTMDQFMTQHEVIPPWSDSDDSDDECSWQVNTTEEYHDEDCLYGIGTLMQDDQVEESTLEEASPDQSVPQQKVDRYEDPFWEASCQKQLVEPTHIMEYLKDLVPKIPIPYTHSARKRNTNRSDKWCATLPGRSHEGKSVSPVKFESVESSGVNQIDF
ncbi:hypothetical protein OSB04_002945 [Centaurea solstitialis]|uniref:Retrotransposon gag domain-containing protein n=1 Tax=Centaurea solstitialis TaxID=347529 RepID=A0AA38TVQ1_9ASTR|nr:hypothetical protein OSB04_002945 [Centaurea solstitialis]